MGKKIYVGNLSYNVTDDSLMKQFEQYGNVDSAKVIMDRDTNRSKGFGFVEMSTDNEASSAISALDGSDLDGRPLKVTEAKPQAPRENRGGFRSSRY